ncbi:hypothetical protein CWATWH0402_5308 [Crocosphaera watsonii WH 0402]|uniref:Uncharacterized protein n=1 Tax=Crocosphaera watsonii WH 0402 TaxID=1284629 RepID=T2JKA4_CROWT|nr:hypothetical protein CWATWH0402_5308 [Crocosphaera watsonii WH 0402]
MEKCSGGIHTKSVSQNPPYVLPDNTVETFPETSGQKWGMARGFSIIRDFR